MKQKKKYGKGLLSCLLALVVVFGTFAGIAPGISVMTYAEPEPVAVIGSTEYTDFNEALSAWSNDTTLKLLADVVTTNPIMVSGKTVTLDLNGHGIKRTGYEHDDSSSESYYVDSVIFVGNNGNLTLTDSNSEVAHKYKIDKEEIGGVWHNRTAVDDTLTEDFQTFTGGYITGGGGRYRADLSYSQCGGGIYVSSGKLDMQAGTIIGNEAGYGGGVYVDNGEFTLNGGDIIGNLTTNGGGGGGAFVGGNGTFIMNSGSSIAYNYSVTNGGGVRVGYDVGDNSTFTMEGGSITENVAGETAAVFNNYNTFNMSGGVITDNKTEGNSVAVSGNISLSGSPAIYGNTCNQGEKNIEITYDDYNGASGFITFTGQVELPEGATKPMIGLTGNVRDEYMPRYFTKDFGRYNPGKDISEFFYLDPGSQSSYGMILKNNEGLLTLPPVKYVDESGEEQNCYEYSEVSRSLIENPIDGSGWYLVNSDVDYSAGMSLNDGDFRFILGDGKKLELSGSVSGNGSDTSLVIYAQSAGTGKMKIENGVTELQTLTINGGDISIKGNYDQAISRCSQLNFNGGTIDITGENSIAIDCDYANINFNGGTINITSSQDAISSYEGNINFKGGTINISAGEGCRAFGSYCDPFTIGDGMVCEQSDNGTDYTPVTADANGKYLPTGRYVKIYVSPLATTAPTVEFTKATGNTGTGPQVGDTLTATVDPENAIGVTYTWYRVDDTTNPAAETVISGASEASYVLTTDDAGKKIKVKASQTLPGNTTITTDLSTATTEVGKMSAPTLTDDQKPTSKADLTYNGNELELVTEPTGTIPDGYTIEYSVDNGVTWTAIPKAVNAGDYTVKVRYKGDDGHEDFDGDGINVNIARAVPTYTIPDNVTATYGQTLSDVALPAGWSWNNGTTSVGASGSGTFEATYTPSDTGNYMTVVKEITVTVAKAVPVIGTEPARVSDLVYSGVSQALITAGTGVTGGVLKYAIGTNSTTPPTNESAWDTEIPAKTESGIYYVWYKVAGDPNHGDTTPVCIPVAISKKAATDALNEDQIPTKNTGLVYTGERLELITPPTGTLPDGYTAIEYSIDNGTTWTTEVPAVINAGDYMVNVRYKGDNNHEDMDGSDIVVNVAKIVPSYTVPEDVVASYGQRLSDVALPDGWSWKDETTSVGELGSRTFTAIYTPADSTNYKTVEADITVTVNKATASVGTAPARIEDLTYTGTEQRLITAGTDVTGGTLKYALGEDAANAPTDPDAWDTEIPIATDAGTYYVWYKVVSDENHNDSEPVCIIVTIEEKKEVDTSIETEVKVADDVPAIKVDNLDNELAVDLLTEKEKAAYDNGVPILVYLDVKLVDKAQAPAADIAAVEKILNDDGYTYGECLDISLWKKLGNGNPAQIHDTHGRPIKITVTMPDTIKNAPAGYRRIFRIIRIHDGVATVMAESSGANLEISSDKFSSYFLVYKDVKIEDETTTAASTSDAVSASTAADAAKSSPKTGDAMPIAVLVILMLSAAAMLVFVDMKKKRNQTP